MIFKVNVVHGGAEVVEIVTPENTKTSTTEPPKQSSPKPSPPTRNKTVDWTSNDSYIQAYKDLHRARPAKRNDPNAFYDGPGKNGQGQPYDTVIRSTYMPEDMYPSLTHQHWISDRPASPSPVYGPASPPSVYGPTSPPSVYGPASPPSVYGPVSPPSAYGPVHHSPAHYHEYGPTRPWRPTPYSSPSSSLLTFLPKKLSLKLLLKIILKLVLFKMIVKFIAVICLLLFIPSLKSKETETETESDTDSEDKWRTRQLNLLSSFIWDSIQDKKVVYEEEEMKDIKEIADQTEDDSSYSGPESAVRFLQFCISTVDRIVGLMLGYLKRQRNERDDLTSFLWEKFKGFVSNF